MSSEIGDMDANMDPWCTVALGKSDYVLFGFATRHHRTGGLAWTRSSLLVALDVHQGWARTFSGTRFHLGERFQLNDLAELGAEALLAFKLLCDPDSTTMNPTPSLQTYEMEENWLTSCKMARHLDLPPPGPLPDVIIRFLFEFSRDYEQHRALLQLPTGRVVPVRPDRQRH